MVTATNGDVVLLPPGEYTLGPDYLEPDIAVTIRGTGSSPSDVVLRKSHDGFMLYDTNTKVIVIEYLTIAGIVPYPTTTGYNGGSAVTNDPGTANLILRDVIFRDHTTNTRGAVWLEASALFERCTFMDNKLLTTDNIQFGGFVFITEGTSTFINCTFQYGVISDNPTSYAYGAAVGVLGDTATSSFVCHGCEFLDNEGTGDTFGGALTVYGAVASADITKCTFGRNKGWVGGAISVLYDSSITITDSIFFDNLATDATGVAGGGAIRCGDGTMSLTHSIFVNNIANLVGGAIDGDDDGWTGKQYCIFATFSDNTFCMNRAFADSQTNDYATYSGETCVSCKQDDMSVCCDESSLGEIYVPWPTVHLAHTQACRCLLGNGHYPAGAMCTPCPGGMYAEFNRSWDATPEGGEQRCAPCPVDSYSPVESEGISSCAACGLGLEPTPDRTTCVPCGVGYYEPSHGCEPCPIGSYTDSQGETVCTPCPDDEITYDVGSTSVDDCYSENNDTCLPGSYINQGPCEECDRGSYSIVVDATSCIPCDPGYFQSEVGATLCDGCPSGRYSNTSESIICTVCDPGSYSVGEGVTVCSLCSNGTFQKFYEEFSCLDCTVGSYSGEGATRCENCLVGYFSNDTTYYGCHKCAPGTFQDEEGKSSCSVCLSGSISDAGATGCEECDPGWYANDIHTECFPCENGTFSSSPGQISSCSPCIPGYYSGLGASICIRCDRGSYTEDFATKVCTLCEENTYSNELGKTSCLPCPGVSVAPKGSTACWDCEGTPFGPKVNDTCGNCTATPETNMCLCPSSDCDCAGVDGGSAEYDLCGVCNGTSRSCCSDHGLFNGVVCTCDVGYWGATCSHACAQGCVGGECDGVTGVCSCLPMYYGTNCSMSCDAQCATCSPVDGKCITCSQELWWGEDCILPCSSFCPGAGTCDKFNGFCNGCIGSECTCLDGYYGPLCNLTCPCPGVCNMTTGFCLMECEAGKWGAYCEKNCSLGCSNTTCEQATAACSPCVDGMYGSTCSLQCEECLQCEAGSGDCVLCSSATVWGPSCSTPCAYCADGTCAVNGTCSPCTQGYYGPMCNQSCPNCAAPGCHQDAGLCMACPPGFYGPNCASACSLACVQCNNGLVGDGSCASCTNSTWGSHCNTSCPIECTGDCSQLTGNCYDCVPQHWGDHCEHVCTACTTCNTTTGDCLSCPLSTQWGPQCLNCSSHCAVPGCNSINGSCSPCVDEYHGETCDEECTGCDRCAQSTGFCLECVGSTTWGGFCQVPCASHCLDGKCILDTGRCIGCDSGFWGDSCLKACGNCLVCDQDTGSCLCEAGQYSVGSSCELCLPGSYNDVANASSCSLCTPGWYQPSPGQAVCFECAGELTSLEGADSCVDCANISFGPNRVDACGDCVLEGTGVSNPALCGDDPPVDGDTTTTNSNLLNMDIPYLDTKYELPALAGAVVVVAMVMLLVCCLRRRKKNKGHEMLPVLPESTSDAGGSFGSLGSFGSVSGFGGMTAGSLASGNSGSFASSMMSAPPSMLEWKPDDELLFSDKLGGGLKLISVLGQGTFGKVWLGETAKQEKVAVKIFTGRQTDQARADFINECQTLNGMDHPNVVGFLAASTDPLVLVLEYVSNGTLGDVLEPGEGKEPPEWPVRLNMLLDVAKGMQYLQQEGVCHRDLKPQNILIGEKNIAKITDFGLSRTTEATMAETMHMAGSPRFMAPEMFVKRFSRKSDVYSFGIILWEVYTLKQARKKCKGLAQIYSEVVVKKATPKIPADCPKLLANLILDCLKNDPRQRPNFDEIVVRLEWVRMEIASGGSIGSATLGMSGYFDLMLGGSQDAISPSGSMQSVGALEHDVRDATMARMLMAVDDPSVSHLYAKLPEEQQEVAQDPPGKQNLVIDEDGGVRAGSLNALVQWLTTHQDEEFAITFFNTFRSFVSPITLVNLLVGRFNLEPPQDVEELEQFLETVQKPERIRICDCFSHWISKHYYDWTPAMLDKLAVFMRDDLVAAGMKMHAETLARIAEKSKKDYEKRVERAQYLIWLKELRKQQEEVMRMIDASAQESSSDSEGEEGAAPAPMLPTASTAITLYLMGWPSVEIARQLALIDFDLYRRIQPKECLNQAWSKKDKDMRAPNILGFIDRFNQVGTFVSSLIVLTKEIKDRVLLLEKLIDIAVECHNLSNYNSVMTILSGLGCSQVHRLHKTWNKLSTKSSRAYQKLTTLMSVRGSYSALRKDLEAREPPIIPFMGVYLTDLTFIEDGNSDVYCVAEEDGGLELINFKKRLMLSRVISQLTGHVEKSYKFAVVPQLREHLLRAEPSLPEDEQWEESQQRELRQIK